MRPCPACGEENPKSARFCSVCGVRLGAGGEARDERKVVTVFFVDLAGFTSRAEQLDPEDVRRLLDPYHERVRAELERFGGTVEKFIGDAVMALFGAPLTREDDAERAVRAAFAVREAIDELNRGDPTLDLQVRIGINTGEALVKLDARTAGGESMAAGDVVNTAARLQQAAPVGGILVGEATYRATASAVDYAGPEPVRAKGKQAPVKARRPLALRARQPAPRGAGSLVGRIHELELLVEAVRRARHDAAPQRVTLVGPPGIGKSRLVWELCHSLGEGPDAVLWRHGRALPYGEGVTFWPFAEIVKAQAGILETDAAETAERKLGTAVAEAVADPAEAAWIEQHLRPLVGLVGSDRARDDGRGEAFAAWRSFVEALARRGLLVLVFEDVHWADDGLLDFVDHLAEWASDVPLVLVCTARPELYERRPAWGNGTKLLLEPLSSDDTASLLDSLLGEAVLAGGLRSALLARAGGNPLYAEEYVRMLSDRGILVREDGAERLEWKGELPLPESVQAIIAARVDALAPECKGVLQDAAVVGKGFWAGALERMSGPEASAVDRHLGDLQRKEFVRPQPRSSVADESQYAFSHVLVRDIAYGQIPRSRRAQKHCLVAEWIESLAPDRAENLAEMLAHHYRSAIEYARLSRQDTTALAERGRLALRDAGDRALALYAFAAAVGFYAQAVELWPPDDPERPQLLFRYGKALFWAESAGEDVLAEARDALLAAGDRETAAEADVLRSRLLLTRGERARASELVRSAISLLADAPPCRSKADALSNLAAFLVVGGEFEEAVAVGFEARQMAEELELREIEAHSLTSIGVARAAIGDPGGIPDLERSVAILDELNSPWVVRSCANLGSLLANLGQLRRAADVNAKARKAAERFADVRGLRWLAAERAYEDYWRGDWDGALAAADRILDGPTGEGEQYAGSGSRDVRVWIRLARGDLAGALEDAARSLDFARSVGDPQLLYPALALRARVALAHGDVDEGAKLARELLDRWGESAALLASFWTADLAFVLRALGRDHELLSLAERANASSRWLAAALLLAGGRLTEAADAYAEIGALPEEALARQAAAAALAPRGCRDEADLELRRALEFFRRVRADVYVESCEALLVAQV